MFVYSWFTLNKQTYVNRLFTYVNRLFTHVNSLFLIKLNNLPSSWNVTKQFHDYPR